MKHLYFIALVAGISFAGEFLNRVLPLPVPGSIYGLLIMLALLLTGAVKLERVREGGNFLIGIMSVMFIAPSVGLMTSFDTYRDFLVPAVIICLLSTLVVMAATGLTAQKILRRGRRADDGEEAQP